jgi:eukaryotic-like serine/threonine-protein kinase
LKPEQWRTVKIFVSKLLELPRMERQSYLQQHCNDTLVRAEVQSLISEYERDEFDGFPLVERFLPRRRLGAGGFGTVFEAYDCEQQIVLALKVLKQRDATSLDRFKREFWTLRELDHPNLVKLYQLFQGDRCWFFTMQLVRGCGFLDYVNSPEGLEGRMTSVSHRIQIRSAFAQLCRGVQALHTSGKLHRDIKPENILVSHGGVVTLIDLGMTRELASIPVQQSVAIIGSAHYLSPEQGCGGTLTEATDWYSVGVILFEALTGHCPFDGDMLEIIEQKRTRSAAEPIALVSEIPADLNSLCRDLLQIDPAARPTGPEVIRRFGDTQNENRKSFSQQRHPVFVGREAALKGLKDLFESTQHSHKCVVANIKGKSGIGKSTLIREFQRQVNDEWPGAILLAGRCHESARVRFKALDLLIDRLVIHLRTLLPLEVKALLPRDLTCLVQLFPTLKQVDTIARIRLNRSVMLDSQELRDRAFAAFVELLGRLGDARPILVCIDDVQWADKDSAVFFRHLLSHSSPPKMLVVISGRSEDLDSSPFLQQYQVDLSDIRAFNNGVEIADFEINELSMVEARELAWRLLSANSEIDDQTLDAIVQESSGIPFLIVEFVRYAAACVAEGRVPKFTLEDVLRERTAALPAASRTLLTIVAVASQPVPETVAYKAARLEADDFPGLQSLTSDSLVRVRETPEGRELETYHDRYREAVLNALEHENRRQAHLALASALAEYANPDPAFIATQYRSAGESELAAQQFLSAAERASAAYAFDQASEFYRLARQLGSYAVEDELRVARLHGEALVQAGRGSEAAQVFQLAALRARGLEQLEFQRRAAEQLLRSGDLNDGLQLVRSVAKTLRIWIGEKTWQTLLSLRWRRARIHIVGRRLRLRSPHEISEKDLAILDTYWSLAVGLSLVDMVRASDFSARHFLKAIRTGEPQRIALSLALQAGHANIQGNRRREAETALVYANELAQRHGQKQVLAVVEGMGAVCGYLAGEWRSAYASGVRGEKILREECTGVRWEIVSTCIFSLKCLNMTGDWKIYAERLLPLLKEARVKGDRYALTGLQLLTHSYILNLAADDPTEARRNIREALAGWAQDGFHLQDFFGFYGETETDLYEGLAEPAFERVNLVWPLLNSTLLIRGQVIKILALHIQARSLLAVSMDLSRLNPQRARVLRSRAFRSAKIIAGERVQWGHALSELIKASHWLQKRDVGACLKALVAAEEEFAGADMHQYHAAARWCRGHLCGGAEGLKLISAAESWMIDQGVKNPRRMIRLLAPGRWENAFHRAEGGIPDYGATHNF